MKTGISLASGLFIIGVVLGVIELWFTPWSPALFIKLEMTLGALLLIICVILFVVREYRLTRSINSGKGLDGD
jgi:hypothetical protein